MQSRDRLIAVIGVWLCFALIVIVALLNDQRFASEELFLTVILALVVLGTTAVLTDEHFGDWWQHNWGQRARTNGSARYSPDKPHVDNHPTIPPH